MSRYSEWWFSRFSDDWWDLTTIRGFAGGLLTLVQNLLTFLVMFVLALQLGIIPSETGGLSGAFNLLFFPTVFGSILLGAGLVYLGHKNDRIRQLTRTFSGRATAFVVVYGAFWLLLTYNYYLAFYAAIAYMLGKVITLFGIFIGHRV